MAARRSRFPLEMSDGTKVNSLDDLKEHFDLEAVLGYYKSGTLLTWLQARYLEDEAEAVSALDESAPDFQKNLCAVFEVEFQGKEVDLEEIERRQERLKRLRQFTDEEIYIDHIDQVAFDQEELADLLDDGVETIYLCGEKFSIPASQKGKTYIGINQPEVKISGKYTPDDLEIRFEGCAVEQFLRLKDRVVSNSGEIIDTNSSNKKHLLAQDICPIFKNQLTDCLDFTKLWFIKNSIDESKDHPIRFNTILERYLSNKSGFLSYGNSMPSSAEMDKINVGSNGMPNAANLSSTDILVCKAALRVKMSNTEQIQYDVIERDIKSKLSQYYDMKACVDHIEKYGFMAGLDRLEDYDKEAIAERMIDCGWFSSQDVKKVCDALGVDMNLLIKALNITLDNK